MRPNSKSVSIFCRLVLVPVAAGTWVGQADGLPAPQTEKIPTAAAPQEPATGDSAQLSGSENKQIPEDRQRAIDFLVNELVQLTPGKSGLSAELKAAYATAAGNVVDTKPEEARATLDAAAAEHPTMPPAGLLMSAMYFAGGNAAQGSVMLEETSLKHADYPLVYTAFARLALSQQRRTDARVLLEKADQLMQANPATDPVVAAHFSDSNLDARIDLYILDQKVDQARQALEQLRERDPENARTWLRLGEVAFRQEKPEESLDFLKKYSAAEKNAPEAELLLATFYQQTGKAEEAGQWVQKAFENHPENVSVLTQYATWQVNQENFDLANQALAKVENLAGNMPAATLLKGKMAFAQQSYELAESRFAELVKLDPNNSEVANLWAMALAESSSSEKLARALEQAQKNMQQQPQNPFAATVLGWVYFRQKNMEQANVWFSRAAQSRNLPPEAAYYFARFLQKVGQTEQALQLVNGALESDNLFLYRNSAVALKGELTAADNSLKAPNDK